MPLQTGSSTASRTQPTPGSTRRSVILTAAAAASSSLVQPDISRAAIVQTDTAKLPPLPLPAGIRSRYVPNINGLTFHVLEAGFESKGRPCLLLLHDAETQKRNLCHHRLRDRTIRDRVECPYIEVIATAQQRRQPIARPVDYAPR